jgi:mono/diheme cytochrome c family protein
MRLLILCLGVFLVALVAFFIATSPARISPIASAQQLTFGTDLIARGELLAAIGNCDTCHTVKGGTRFAGGRGIPTPFGTIYSTNITPDRDTGLGTWSEQAFQRAMHDGIARDGHYLYPAFPYDHFTKVTTEDNQALYAFLMSRPAVSAAAPENSVWFPLRFRRLVAVWNWLYLKKGLQLNDPNESPAWNRGAYWVNGLGHCGSCHTPRNLLGAERSGRAMAGGRAEGWDAYALDATSPAPLAWDVDSLAAFLKTGWHAEHGNARGPMLPVTDDLARVAALDVRAMSTYLVSNMQRPSATQRIKTARVATDGSSHGADIFNASCASCHESGEPPPFGGIDFVRSSSGNAPEPRNMVFVTLAGLPAADGRAAGMMPGFDGAISDEDLAALLGYMRERFTAQPPWQDLKHTVQKARQALKENASP